MLNEIEIFISKVDVPARIYLDMWTPYSLQISAGFRCSHVATLHGALKNACFHSYCRHSLLVWLIAEGLQENLEERDFLSLLLS
jgi:hypothetical protein